MKKLGLLFLLLALSAPLPVFASDLVHAKPISGKMSLS